MEGTAAPPSGGGRQLTVLPAALTTKGGWLQPGGFSFAKVVTGEAIALQRTLTPTLTLNPTPTLTLTLTFTLTFPLTPTRSSPSRREEA